MAVVDAESWEDYVTVARQISTLLPLHEKFLQLIGLEQWYFSLI